MKMKKICSILFFLLFILPCSAEIKFRIDNYRDFQVKINWSTKYTSGPDNSNWAKKKWPEGVISGLEYVYLVNPKECNDKGRVSIEKLTYGNGYQYHNMIYIWAYYPDDDEWVKLDSYGYYFNDNSWYYDFEKWRMVFDKYLTYDER